LYYYGARWYDPTTGRFISADTITPGDVQGLDRYAYTFNNPIRYVDPSGHSGCKDNHVSEGDCSDSTIRDQLTEYGVTLTGDWNPIDVWAVLKAIESVGQAFSGAFLISITSQEAFKSVYDHITITMGLVGAMRKCATISSGGCTSGTHQINFVSGNNMSFLNSTIPGGYRTPEMAFIANRNLVVHELGHAFASRWKDSNPQHPYQAVTDKYMNEEGWAISPDSAKLTWRQHPSSMDNGTFIAGEVFADMFLGWTFDTWGSGNMGAARQYFMNTNIVEWITSS
jgi:hypothetical protein